MVSLLAFLHSAFCYGATAFLLAALSLCACVTAPFAADAQSHYQRWARVWAQSVLLACRVKVEVEGLDYLVERMAKGPLVLASNHSSMLDIPILLATLPGYFAFFSKVEVFSLPIMGQYMELCGFVSVRRGDRASIEKALDHSVEALRAGRSILMFPEGTRTPDGNLGPFKRGAALLATRAGVPILPMAIVGSYEILPKQTLVARPGLVTLRIGQVQNLDAIDGSSPDRIEQATDRLRNAVEGLFVRPPTLIAATQAAPTRRV